ncbi:MAG: N-acetyltransferase family protein [Alphaproteobacteria bacterium]
MAEVRLLTVHDADIFHALRLRAVKEESDSFLETEEEVAAKSAQDYFKDGWIAGAFEAGKLVGITGLFRYKGRKLQHKGHVWGVYVVPGARGQKLSSRMLELLLASAKQAGIERVLLSANEKSLHTQDIYMRLGFEPYGVERNLMKRPDGSYISDVLMTKVLG